MNINVDNIINVVELYDIENCSPVYHYMHEGDSLGKFIPFVIWKTPIYFGLN